MARGNMKAIGDRFTNQNGYTYEKTEEGWVGVHILLAEQNIGRKLKEHERAFFKDGDRTNLTPENIGVKSSRKSKSPKAQLAIVDAQIAEAREKLRDLLEEKDDLQQQIAREELP